PGAAQMSIVFLLIPLGMVLLGLAVAALFWAVNSGQYDDIDEASRPVLEPDAPVTDTFEDHG
ncbi:MAG TPA: cbb3-type cytochrome oxidase assembly protein CcoS, partial [Steroidobacteraceae bacterium]